MNNVEIVYRLRVDLAQGQSISKQEAFFSAVASCAAELNVEHVVFWTGGPTWGAYLLAESAASTKIYPLRSRIGNIAMRYGVELVSPN